MGYPSYPRRVVWVAFPPGGRRVAKTPGEPPPYVGPPAYPIPPRWGLPGLAWRGSNLVPGTAVRPPRSAATLASAARTARSALWLVAVGALLAGTGEIWRYVLLVLGRDEALSSDLVTVSNALITTGATLSLVAGVAALVLTVRWLFAARELAAEGTGYLPARADWQTLLGVLLPGVNLFMAGSVLAELEHAVLRRPAIQRPRPSRLVLAWWLAWGVGEAVAALTLLGGLRADVQARADGVLWHALTDLLAVLVAVLTVRVVRLITALLGPARPRGSRWRQVLAVRDAPAPSPRPPRPGGCVR